MHKINRDINKMNKKYVFDKLIDSNDPKFENLNTGPHDNVTKLDLEKFLQHSVFQSAPQIYSICDRVIETKNNVIIGSGEYQYTLLFCIDKISKNIKKIIPMTMSQRYWLGYWDDFVILMDYEQRLFELYDENLNFVQDMCPTNEHCEYYFHKILNESTGLMEHVILSYNIDALKEPRMKLYKLVYNN